MISSTPQKQPPPKTADSGVEVLESASAVVGPGGDVTVVWDQEARPLKVRTATP